MDLKSLNNIFLSVPAKEQVLFAKHLSIMTKAGMPISDSILMLQKQTKSKSFKKILTGVMLEVNNGQFLSASMERYRSIFGDLFISILRVGEASGTLSENLEYLSQELEKRRMLRKKVKGAMIYPVIVLTATLAVTWLLSFYVMPKIFPIFESMNVKLPITTRMLMWFSKFVQSNSLELFIGLAAFIVFMKAILKVRAIRFMWHKVILIMPIFKNLSVQFNMALFARTLSVLLKSGVKIVEAITITADSLTNLAYKNELRKAAEEVRRGQMVNQYLKTRERMFPPTLSRMIEVGETTGNLDSNLNYLAEFYEKELDDITRNLSSIMEPILLIVMGGIVAFVALSVLLPLYSLTSSF